jgi:hypothetical protein
MVDAKKKEDAVKGKAKASTGQFESVLESFA